MHSLSDDDRQKVLSEVMMDELKAIHELVQDVPEIKRDINVMKEDIAELKSDMKVVKAVLKDHSKSMTKLESRVDVLEAA